MSVIIRLPSGRELTAVQIDALLDKMTHLLDIGTAIGILGCGQTQAITSQSLFKRASASRIEKSTYTQDGEDRILFTIVEAHQVSE